MNTNTRKARAKTKATAASIAKWMPLWIGDIRRECIGQSPEFVGMYVNLMMAAWEAGGSGLFAAALVRHFPLLPVRPAPPRRRHG